MRLGLIYTLLVMVTTIDIATTFTFYANQKYFLALTGTVTTIPLLTALLLLLIAMDDTNGV